MVTDIIDMILIIIKSWEKELESISYATTKNCAYLDLSYVLLQAK